MELTITIEELYEKAVKYLLEQSDWIETYDLRIEMYQSGYSKEEVAECITYLRNSSQIAIIYNSEERREYIRAYMSNAFTDLMQKEINIFNEED